MSSSRNDSRDPLRAPISAPNAAATEDAEEILRGIVMFHIGRSGSTVLGDLLGQHSAIRWDSEIYERVFRDVERNAGPLFLTSDASAPVLAQQAWRPLLPADPLQHLQKRISQICVDKAWKSFYGFEVKFFHLRFFGMSLVDYVEGLKEFGFEAFVVLKRRNLLRKIVSSLVAEQAKQYHFRHGETVPRQAIVLDLEQVSVDREQKSFLQFLEKYDEMFALLDELLEGERVLELVYEDDLLDDPQQGYRKVCEFLNLAWEPSSVNFVRTNPFPLREILVNFEEVARALRGTPYAWMLDD